MKSRSYVGFALIAAYCLVVSACGGGGGGGGGTPAKAVAVTATSPILINYSTTVFANFSGIPVADGSSVTFSANNGGVMTDTTLVGAVGNPIRTATARVKLSAPPASPQTRSVTVTAAAGGYSGNTVVAFIPQPTKAVVHVATNQSVIDTAWFNTRVLSNVSAFTSWSSPTVTQAPAYAGVGSALLVNDIDEINAKSIFTWVILALGVDVSPNSVLLDLTYRIDPTPPVATVGIPFFTVVPDATAETLSFGRYSSPNNLPDPPTNGPVSRLLTPSDYQLKTDYYLGSTLLATH